MIVELTHPFLMGCIDRKGLLENNPKKKNMTFGMFSSKLRKQATVKATKGDGEIDTDKENKYKGDGFELFVEVFIRVFGSDMLVSIVPESYEVVLSSGGNDTGVDGFGVGNDGKMHTVQAKFCIGDVELTANKHRLTNFTSTSMLRYKVDMNSPCNLENRPGIDGKINMTIIHTGKGINHYTEDNMLCGVVRAIGLKDIKNKVDGNNIFWDCFRKSWEKYNKELIERQEKKDE